MPEFYKDIFYDSYGREIYKINIKDNICYKIYQKINLI